MRKPIFEIGTAVICILLLFTILLYYNIFNFSSRKCYYQGIAPSFQSLILSTSIISQTDFPVVSWRTNTETDSVIIFGIQDEFFFTGKTLVQEGTLKISASNSSCETIIERRFLVLPIPQVYVSFILILLLLVSYSLSLVSRSKTTSGQLDSFLQDAFNATSILKPLGVVIDYATKEPISGVIVRLYEAGRKNLLMTSVTNTNGEFSMSVESGTYYFEISKDGYSPIDTFSNFNQNTFTVTADQIFSLPEKTSSIAVTIYIQPSTMNGTNNTKYSLQGNILPQFSLQKVLLVSFTTVLFIQLMFVILNPIIINILLLGAIALLFVIIYRREFSQKEASGYLINQKGFPLAGVEVGIFDTEFRVLLGQTFTDKSGQFFLEWTTQKSIVLQLLDIRYVFDNNERSINIKQYASTKQGSKVITGVYKTKHQLTEL